MGLTRGAIASLFLCPSAFAINGCASVSVIPLTADGQPKNEAPGMRYYMPKPYLLVTRTPAEAVVVGGAGGSDGAGRPADISPEPAPGAIPGAAPGAAPGAGASPTKTASQAAPSQASASPTSDLSYQLGNNSYLLKLIYLPDMSKTMAINLVPGIFGTSSLQPTLQDGWMLTSMQASADNTKAMDDLTTLATALIGGGKSAATKTATGAAKAANIGKKKAPGAENPDVLPPGLYEFQYDAQGRLIGLCGVSRFSSSGVANSNRCRSTEALAALNWVQARY